jgi:hypothetical protein
VDHPRNRGPFIEVDRASQSEVATARPTANLIKADAAAGQRQIGIGVGESQRQAEVEGGVAHGRLSPQRPSRLRRTRHTCRYRETATGGVDGRAGEFQQHQILIALHVHADLAGKGPSTSDAQAPLGCRQHERADRAAAVGNIDADRLRSLDATGTTADLKLRHPQCPIRGPRTAQRAVQMQLAAARGL